MDPTAAYTSTVDSIDAAEQRHAQFAGFLDKSMSVGDRLESARDTAGPQSDEDAAATAAIWQDASEPTPVRVAALNAMGTQIGEDNGLIDAMLKTLQSTDDPPELRRGALSMLRRLRFSSALIQSRRADYMQALRAICRDADVSLRSDALDMLAQQKDTLAQDLLVEGLKNPAAALVPPERAVQMLGYDIHAGHFPVLRDIVANPPNPAARQNALRLLSADPGSKELLAGIFADPNEGEAARRTSGIALQALDPDTFEQHARRIALDAGENAAVRATSLSALATLSEHEASGEDANFNEAVRSLTEADTSPHLTKAVNAFLASRVDAKR